jgi:hypothetical protein
MVGEYITTLPKMIFEKVDQAIRDFAILLPEKWFTVISWAKQCGRMKQEPSSPTFSTFEEKSLHSCLPFYYLTFPVSVWSR